MCPSQLVYSAARGLYWVYEEFTADGVCLIVSIGFKCSCALNLQVFTLSSDFTSKNVYEKNVRFIINPVKSRF